MLFASYIWGQMITTIDSIRIEASKGLDQSKRGELGQFMTPSVIAKFMASLFPKTNKPIHLLEAGAGIGSLIIPFLDHILIAKQSKYDVAVTAYEIDAHLLNYLEDNLNKYKCYLKSQGVDLKTHVIQKDFILDAVSTMNARYTHSILNPPYKKINSLSEHRLALRQLGQEHVNLYSAFVGLSLSMLQKNGQLVAIIPRSFCNGVYYKPFRNFLLNNASIKRLHLFESRKQAFKEDDVLQENIIIHLEKGGKQGLVNVSKSTGHDFDDLMELQLPFESIVKQGDNELFIHVPEVASEPIFLHEKIKYELKDLGLQVSTGPVVDFRMKDFLSMKSVKGSMPLLYPTHFNGNSIEWPKESKKPNALIINEETIKASIPNGYYTVVKRFSSKEEKQRIVARVVNPNLFRSKYLGLENHLNYFHSMKKGIDEDVAYGLAAYLNTSFVDKHFRTFNGHTQVNATDLKQMKYPSLETLQRIGKWAKKIENFSPENLTDKVLNSL